MSDLFPSRVPLALRARGWLPTPDGWWERPDGCKFSQEEATNQLKRLEDAEARLGGDESPTEPKQVDPIFAAAKEMARRAEFNRKFRLDGEE